MLSHQGILLTGLMIAMNLPANITDAADSTMTIHRLRCEYLENPLGIDVARPRLSWAMLSTQRGQRQTAYQILVARNADVLARDEGDLWDTGKVASDETVHLVYDGKAMVSGLRAWWKVRSWDIGDQPTAWSEPAWWEMGLLDTDDWKGQWIAGQPDRQQMIAPFTPERLRWIWFPEADAKTKAKPPKDVPRFFRKTFELPADRELRQGKLLLTVDDHYVLYVNGQEIGSNDYWQMLHVYDVTRHLRSETNVLAIAAKNYGDAAGVIGQLRVDFAAGDPVLIDTDTGWKTTDQEQPDWREAAFDDASWPTAVEVGTFGGEPWGKLYLLPESRPAPLLRKEATLNKPVKSAQAYICGLGYHELRINGEKVGDHRLDPGFTDYDKRALYVSFDVTSQLKQGTNALGIVLGNGWYNMHTRAVWDFDKAPWRDAPCAKLQLNIVYEDGTSEQIVSDGSWRVSDGPIVFNAVRNGETYDARLEQVDWDKAGFNAAGWREPEQVTGPAGQIVAQMMPPIRVVETIKPVKVTEAKPGVFVFDIGQNMPGWARLTVSGPAGTKVSMRYGERLNADGTVNQDKIKEHSRQAPFQTDTYILKSQGTEIWEPRFVYHGFQYVEVTGFPGTPTTDNLDACVAHTSFRQAGEFKCSDETLNRIQQCTLWSYRGNYHSYPTDCPHREKNGWTGDAHMAAGQAMFNFDNAAAYTKWIEDCRDAMTDKGELPGIVPTGGWGYTWGNGPAWDSAYLLIPWNLYLYCGDTRILEEHYEQFKRYVDYLTSRAEDHIVSFGLGDWVCLDQKTPEAVTSTGYYYVDAVMLAKIARTIGRDADANKYEKLASQIREAFVKKFCDPQTGVVATGSQTAQACAIYQGLIDGDLAKKATDQLVANIERCDRRINSGVLGSIYIPHALVRMGRPDVAWGLISTTEYPSWGHWMQQGANTLWEDWKGEASLNHIFFGDISAWFYQHLAGINIDPDRPAFKHVIVRPHVLGHLEFARAELDTIRGTVRAGWRIGDRTLYVGIDLPPNTTATVYVPGEEPGDLAVNGALLHNTEHTRLVKVEDGRCVFEVDSGLHSFAVRNWPKPGN